MFSKFEKYHQSLNDLSSVGENFKTLADYNCWQIPANGKTNIDFVLILE
jgi:hypothetical protein